jgi:tetratricopeptide (TPR) repeat protein
MTATGTYADGKPVHGKWHIYPEMAAAGLWTTPTDLAHFAIEIALSEQGKANHVLSEKTTREMLTPVKEEVTLGFFLDKQNPGQFEHNGSDEGFQALLTMNKETGKGVVIMANSDHGIAVADALMRRVAKEYAWNYKPHEGGGQNLYLIARVKGASAALERFADEKKSGAIDEKDAESTINQLGYMLLYGGKEKDAAQVFQKNVQDYPQSSNVYDSLGEAYMNMGQKDLAIQNYEKSLELNPENRNAVARLKKLREMK